MRGELYQTAQILRKVNFCISGGSLLLLSLRIVDGTRPASLWTAAVQAVELAELTQDVRHADLPA